MVAEATLKRKNRKVEAIVKRAIAKRRRNRSSGKNKCRISKAKLIVEKIKETGDLTTVLLVKRKYDRSGEYRLEAFHEMPQLLGEYLNPFTLNEVKEIRKMIADQLAEMSYNAGDLPPEFIDVAADLEKIEKQKTSKVFRWIMKCDQSRRRHLVQKTR